MADLATLEKALRSADAAGDTAAATRFAQEIRKMQGAQTAEGKTDMQPVSEALTPTRYWGTSQTASDMLTGGLQSKLNAAGGGLIDATIGAIKGDGWNYSDNYNKHLEFQRGEQQQFEEQNPGKALFGKATGVALGVTSLPVFGQGIKGALMTGGGYGGVMGLGQDADSMTDRAYNTLKGAGTGAAIGGAGYGAGAAVGAGLTKISRAMQGVTAEAPTRAATKISQLVDEKFPNSSHVMQKQLNDLGPDAMLFDVLGEQGTAVGRNAANINPNARETIETAVLGRKAGQNQRLVSDIEAAAGVPVGNRKGVETFKKEAFDAVRPQINQAYDASRKAGEDIPLDYFKDVLDSPLGEETFKSAVSSLRNRMAVSGDKAGGNLAVIDEMKKILDSKAEMARRSGDMATADVAGTMAKHLRGQMDSLLDNGEYALARGLRKQAYKAEEAFDVGESLAGGRVPFDTLAAAKKVDPSVGANMAKAYAAKQAENLLNKGSTEGALNSLSTPLGKEAYTLALKGNAPTVDKALSREKSFNKIAKALTGNSTTARQLAEMGATGVGTAATTLAMGYDATTGGIAGILGALLRKGGPAIAKKLATSSQREAAPLIAEMLAGKNLPPAQQVLPPAVLERLTKADRGKLIKALLPSYQQYQNTKPQMNEAR